MKKQYYIFLLLFIILIFSIFYFQPKQILIRSGNKIKNIIEKKAKKNQLEQILINYNYKIDNKTYNTFGKGVIFLEDNYSFFLEFCGKCIIKMPYEDELMFQDSACPIYRMFSGIKFKVVKLGDGLYYEDEKYVFKGDNLDNNLLLNNKVYKIKSFDEDILILNDNTKIKNNYKSISGDGSKTNPYILIKRA